MPVCQHGLSLAVSSFRQLRYSKFDSPLAPQSSTLVCVRRHCTSRPHFSIRGADGKPHLLGGEARQHGHSSRRGGRLAVGLRQQILRTTCNSKSRSLARLAQSVERKALNLVVVGSSPTVGVSMFGGVCFPCRRALSEKRDVLSDSHLCGALWQEVSCNE